MNIRPYRYYLIDLDRTLWDFDRNSEHAIGLLISRTPELLRAVQEKEGRGEDSMHRFFMRYDVLNHRLWAMYESGKMTKEDLRWKRFHEAFRWYGIEDEALSRNFGEQYLEQMVHETALMTGEREMQESIRKTGGRMAILSNGFKEVQYRKLRGAGIDGYFQAVVVSEEAGCLKPRPGIFARAVEVLSGMDRNGDPERWREVKSLSLMIGDDPVNDILGAQVFGIDQYYFNHKRIKSLSRPTYEAADLPVFLPEKTSFRE